MGHPALILGSASPRRAELLSRLGLEFSVRQADIDETPLVGEAAQDYVRRMAREKALALRDEVGAQPLLTADTTVILDQHILGKPRDAADAREMLRSLSHRSHEVCTAIAVTARDRYAEDCVLTKVEFIALSDTLIDAYLRSDEPWDKAGAYAVQGLAASFVRGIQGSVSNVIGLPLAETRELLGQFGIVAGVARTAPSASVFPATLSAGRPE